MNRDDAEKIKELLNKDLERLIKHFWSGAIISPGRPIAHPIPGKKNGDLGSFQVYVKPQGGYHRGDWVRSSAGIGGDELNLFAYGFTGCRSHHATREVFEAAREFVGMSRSRPETDSEREQRIADQDEFRRQREEEDKQAQAAALVRSQDAGDIFQESLLLADTQGAAYVLGRGVPMPPGGWWDVVRFHPALPLVPDSPPSHSNPRMPAVVCRVDDVFGDLTAIWRIYLHATKAEKAPIKNAKLGFGPAAGGAIRLGGVAPRIGAAEGFETAGGACALIQYRYPVWAMMSTSGMIGFEPPMEVEWVTGFPDGDKPWNKVGDELVLAEPPGRAAVRKQRERMIAAGRKYDQQPEPPIRKDYLDIWNARRRRVEEYA